jgi:hypothetical protein
MGNFLKNQKIRGQSIGIPSGGTGTRPAAPQFGAFRYNTDLGQMEYFNGTVFKQLSIAGEIDIVVDEFTGDGSTLTFSLSETVTGVNQVLVFVGNIYQQPSTYTITGGGNDITFTEAPPDNATINVIQNIASTDAS